MLAKRVHEKDPTMVCNNCLSSSFCLSIYIPPPSPPPPSLPLPLPPSLSPLPPPPPSLSPQILRKAVNGMLPKNLLRKKRMRRLHLFADADHPYILNITHQLPGPCPVYKTLGDYSTEEITAFPDIVRVPHM